MSVKANRPSSHLQQLSTDRGFSSAGDKHQHRTKGKENHHPAVPLTPHGNGLNTPKRDLFRTPTQRFKSEARTPLGTPECFSRVEFETPKVKSGARWSGMGDNPLIGSHEGDGFSVTVAVRVRPFSEKEKKQRDVRCVVSMDGNETTVTTRPGQTSSFCYDLCFWSFDRVKGQYSGQEMVYERLGRPLLDNAFEGYNTCLFAYGQTGSGKSYTIMGYNNETGIIPRFCRELFRRIDENGQEQRAKYTIEISFFEIYNEKIHDLLAASTDTDKDAGKKRATLKVREHPVLGPYVEGLSTFVANSYGDIHSWIELGNKQRATAATGMNDKSSRSHSVFTIVMTKTKAEIIEGDEHTHNVTSKINLVDLAGSERCISAQTTGDRLKEGANINKSLLTLGKVISHLAENSALRRKKFFIPYRDSVLTWLLKESLGGNSKTAMIATISPSSLHVEETLSTLRYAKQARSIINLAKVNEDPKARLIRELRAEIERLRGQGFTTPTRGAPHQSGQDAQRDAATDTHTEAIKESLAEITELRRRLAQSERHMKEAEGSWKERLEESEKRRIREIQEMEKSGVAFKFDNTLPNLVNLNEDPQLSEVLLYVLREGQTRLGKTDEHSGHQIQLAGALVADDHCLITNKEGTLTVRPVGDAQTFVNGQLISRTHPLKHGDRLVVGDHYFRFNHPGQVHDRSKVSDSSVGHVDFEFARNELVAAQSARLEAEIEEERLRNHQEKIEGIKRAQEAAQLELDKQKKKYESQIQQLCLQLEQQLEEKEGLDQDHQNTEKQIQELKMENKILESQVTSSRRRLEMEVRAAQQNLAQTEAYQSRIFLELEREREKAETEAERVRRARERRREKAERMGAGELASAAKSRRSLLQLSMWLQEANNISRKLVKHTVFNRYDVSFGGGGSASQDLQASVQVRVTNSRLGIVTYWSLAKFEDRLIQMREMFKCAERGRDSTDDDVFYNPSDDWEKDYKIDSPVTPSKRVFSSSYTPSRWASLTSSSTGSPRPGSTASLGSANGKRDSVNGLGLASLCRTLLKSCLTSRPRTHEETIADCILGAMQRVNRAVAGLQEAYATRNEAFVSSGDISGSLSSDQMLLQATCSMELLTALISMWDLNPGRSDGHLEAPADESEGELLEQMADTCRKAAGHLMKLLQGCDGDIDSMIAEASTKIAQCLVFLARLVGEASMKAHLNVLTFRDVDDRQENEIVDPELKQGFLNGADVLVDRTLQRGLKAVTSCEADLQVILGPDSHLPQLADSALQHCLTTTTSAKILLHKCQDVQFELASVLDGRDKRLDSAYGHGYRRAGQLILQASQLTNTVVAINRIASPLAAGEVIDWCQLLLLVQALLQVGPALAAAASSCCLLPTPSCSECSDVSLESSVSSATLACRPNHLVSLAGQQLVQSLARFQEFLVSQTQDGSGTQIN
ncbi:kinesin-like protein KIF14 isoform X2 [Acanthaster planci]|uniref:Kinesin-like protein KIF14 isoform X2 n=1 Tax=Acanthaster planci TaxID=133434 RepID=A0A8B7XWW9_ACAPL|nr:kinesin-like protein KIF14 isoform X2 [Acanthaster planci]